MHIDLCWTLLTNEKFNKANTDSFLIKCTYTFKKDRKYGESHIVISLQEFNEHKRFPVKI